MSDNKDTNEQDTTPKKNRYNLSATEQQQNQLEKLFQNIDKPIVIPEKPTDKVFIPPPKDFVRNVSGK